MAASPSAQNTASYGDSLEELDNAVGVILDALKNAGLESHTPIVCFVGIRGQKLDFPTLLGLIFSSLGVALGLYVVLDRRIARAERARDDAAQAQKSPCSRSLQRASPKQDA